MPPIEVRSFREALPADYSALTPPELRFIMRRLPAHCMALGASLSGRPLGLAVAALHEPSRKAKLLALFIDKQHRRRGIGRELYAMLESMLRERRIDTVTAEYLADAGGGEAEAAAARACGFAPPVPGIHIWSGPSNISDTLPWVNRMRLPADFACVSWSSLTAEEKSAIAQGRGNWYPPILDPLWDEERIDTARSLVLRHRGVPIGWMILERFDAKTILFKTMFVQRRYQRLGRGIALLAEAHRRAVREGGYQEFIFYVEEENTDMVRFISRHVCGDGVRKQILWRTAKTL